jgi:colicin import membrane protein
MDFMGDKVALPSLSLPKQRTHWTVGVVIAAGVLLLILGAALYAVLQRQQAAEEAYAKREADRAAMIKAETEKAKAEAEKAVAEAKKKEAEAAASNAAAAQSKAALANSASEDASKNKFANKKKPPKKAAGKPVTAASAPAAATPAAPAKPASKASKDIDDLLRGFK